MNPRDAPESNANGPQWLSVGEVAARLGVSNKTVLRRVRAGQWTARKVAGARGGFAWQVALESSGQQDKTEGTTAPPKGSPSGQRDKASDFGAFERQITGTTEGTPGQQHQDTTGSGTADLIAQLRGEVDYLRAALEREQNAHSEARKLLAGALTMHAHQLTAPAQVATVATSSPNETVRNAQNGPQNGVAGYHSQDAPQRAKTGANGPQTAFSTYGALADWLEQELNR